MSSKFEQLYEAAIAEAKRNQEGTKAATSDDSYEEVTDRKGRPLQPGDRVRIKLYPRGTLEGTVVVNPRVRVVLPDGSSRRALSVKDEADERLYELKSKGALKL